MKTNLFQLLLVSCISLFTVFSTLGQSASCDTLYNYVNGDSFYEISGGDGAALGHDRLSDGTTVDAWAEPYSVTSSTEVRALYFAPWLAHDAGGSVTFNVYTDNSGVPGSVMASEVVNMSEFSANFYYKVEFSTPATVNGNFFVGYELNYAGTAIADSFAIGGTFKPGGTNFTQFLNDGVWKNADDVYTIDPNSDPFVSAWSLQVLTSNAPAPTADYTLNTGTVCLGNGNFLPDASTSSNADYYKFILWDNAVNIEYDEQIGVTPTITPTVADTSQILALYAHGGCRSDAKGYLVDVLPPISASHTTVNSSCGNNNGSITVTNPTGGSETYSYSIDGNTPQSSATFNNVSPGNHTVTVISSGLGCDYTMNVTVNATPQEMISVNAGSTICVGATTSITASGNGTIEWFDGTTSLGNGTSLSVSPTVTKTYNATLTDGNGCTDTKQVTVTVNPYDDASFTFNDFCELSTSNGPSNVVTPGGTFSFNPVPSDGATINASTGEITNGVNGATYTVEHTTNGACPSTSTETVSVQSNDDPSFSYDNICLGNGLTVLPSNIATPGGTYAFATPPTDGATINTSTGEIINPALGSSYAVEYTTPSGTCQATSVENITVYTAPTVNLSATATSICENETTDLTATGNAVTYSWNNGLSNGLSHTVAPTATETYIVTGADAVGCTNSASVTITLNSLPTVDAGVDQTVCENETVNMTATGAVSYAWDNGLGNGATQSITATSTQTYTVTGTDANNCENTDQITVTVDQLPAVDAGQDVSICNGDQITITANGANTYNWDNGLGAGAAHNVSPTVTTTYVVTGTGLNTCENTDQIIVTVTNIPTVNAGVDQTVCEGSEVTLTATSSTGSTVTWDNGITDGTPFTVNTSTTYTATAELNGCSATDQVIVNVNALPSVSAGNNQTTCVNYAPISLTGSPAGGTFSGTGVSNNTFDPATAEVGTHTITYSYTDGNGCENSSTVEITVDGCASIEENEKTVNLNIRPNPASSYIEIETSEKIKQINILSSIGQYIGFEYSQIDTNTTKLDISQLVKGVYFVVVSLENENVVRKVIVQ